MSTAFVRICIVLLFAAQACNRKAIDREDMIVTLKEMGGKGNGRKDNAPIFQRALDMGARKIILDKGNYFISRPLVINNPDVEIIGEGPQATTISGEGNSLLVVRNSPVISEKSDRPVSPRTSVLVMEKAQGITKGMMLHISAPHGLPETTSGGYTSHHTATIDGMQGKEISHNREVEIPFHHDVEISVFRTAPFTLRDLTLESDNTEFLVEVHNRQDVTFSNIVFRSTGKKYMGVFRTTDPQLGVSGIAAYGCLDVVVDNCSFEHIWYGLMAHNGCDRVTLRNSKAFESRHMSNNAIGTDHFVVENCIAEKCEGGFNSHPTALGTTFVNCKDIRSNAPSTFDGRRDSIISCVFDKGFRLSTDEGVIPMAADPEMIYKVVEDTRVEGGRVLITASNVTIAKSVISAPVLPSGINGTLRLHDVVIDVSKPQHDVSSAITIADAPAAGHTYDVALKNVEIIGPFKQHASSVAMGVYIPMRPGVTGTLDNVIIRGFEKGLVLYGGEESMDRYRGFSMNQVLVKDCDYGIFQQDFFDKPMQNADIFFQDCRINDNAPGRIAYSKTRN